MTPTASAVLVGLSLGVAANNTTVVAQTNETVPDSAPEQASPSDGGFFSRLIDPQDGRLDFTAAGGEEGTAAGLVPLLMPDNDPTFF